MKKAETSSGHFRQKKLQKPITHQASKRSEPIILSTAQTKIQKEDKSTIVAGALCDKRSQVNLVPAATMQQLNKNPRVRVNELH